VPAPQHRLDPAPTTETTATTRLTRRAAIGAVALLGVTGGAAVADQRGPRVRRNNWNGGRPLLHGSKPPKPTQSPTTGPTPITIGPTSAPTAPTATSTAASPSPLPPTQQPLARPLVGMSAPADQWDVRLAEVGPGVGARRIFADLADGPTSQLRLVEQALAAGMLPVVSYKVGGDGAGAAAGRWNAVAEQAAARLAAYDATIAVTFWHEPHGDLTPEQYVAASRQLVPLLRRGRLRVGPLLNGWLLDRREVTFASYAPDDLLRTWDWFGIDTYESGTLEAPGPVKPVDRLPLVRAFLDARGSSLPIGVGEYNGYSAATIQAMGQGLLDTPGVWFGCLWNATGGKGHALSGERLGAFRATLTDRMLAQEARPR
jgi:hypothetical protein